MIYSVLVTMTIEHLSKCATIKFYFFFIHCVLVSYIFLAFVHVYSVLKSVCALRNHDLNHWMLVTKSSVYLHVCFCCAFALCLLCICTDLYFLYLILLVLLILTV